MSDGRRAETAHYARAVERAWNELPGGPGIFSPRDWRLVEDWFARGIPLQIVRESIEAAAERLRHGNGEPRRPRGLSYIVPAVEEAWRVMVEGRQGRGGGRQDAAAEPDRPLDTWMRRLLAGRGETALGRLLEGLLARLRGGEEAREVDRRLDDAIEASVPSELLRAARQEVGAELEPYRARMPADAFSATLKKASVARLRATLGLPRLDSGVGAEQPPP